MKPYAFLGFCIVAVGVFGATGRAAQAQAGVQAKAVPVAVPPVARPADVSSPQAVVAALYAVLSGPAGQRDWDRFRSLFLPGALIQAAAPGRGGGVRMIKLTVEEYIRQDDGYYRRNDFYEHELGQRVERYGNIAQVFSAYELLHAPGGAAFQRGIEGCNLIFDGQRWWFVNLLDETETPSNPLPTGLVSSR